MSSTNKTTNYNLSQFVGTDVPSYLGDYNGDMSKIDKAIGDVANSQGSVEQSVVGLTAEVQGLSTQVSGVSTSVQQLQTTVAQIDSGYKQADTALSQRITTNASNIQTNTTAIEGINTTIGTEDISGIGDGTIKGAISNLNSSLTNAGSTELLCTTEVGETNSSEYKTKILTKSIKNYRTLFFCIYSNGDAQIVNCKTVPTPLFNSTLSSGVKLKINTNDDCFISYISDTSVGILSGNASTHVSIYGIK